MRSGGTVGVALQLSQQFVRARVASLSFFFFSFCSCSTRFIKNLTVFLGLVEQRFLFLVALVYVF